MSKSGNVIKIGCFTLIILGLLYFINPFALAENIVSVNTIRDELPRAKSRWLASHISDYQVDVEAFIPLG
jgi:hypothetical protein